MTFQTKTAVPVWPEVFSHQINAMLEMFWHVITGLLMEGSLTCTDHSTTVPLHYLTHAPHKSHRPKAQLLPGPQCHMCPNRFASNLSLPPPPSALHAFSLCAPFSTHPTFPRPQFLPAPRAPLSVCSPFLSCLASALLSVFAQLICSSLTELCFCAAYASSGIPFHTLCGSCPLHFMWGWIFEESPRHGSLSPALSLNTA